MDYPNLNVADFNSNSLRQVCDTIGIDTQFIFTSQMGRTRDLSRQDAFIDMIRLLDADTYINPIGGSQSYSKDDFQRKGIDLWFLEMDNVTYPQFGREFVPSLSVIDVMMFNSKERIRELLQCYSLS